MCKRITFDRPALQLNDNVNTALKQKAKVENHEDYLLQAMQTKQKNSLNSVKSSDLWK